MHKTGIEDYYIIKDNRKLRYGYTTGTCAAAAAKAAALMLLGGDPVHTVPIMTPKGIGLDLEILDISMKEDEVSCAVQKDGGDDPDATHGILVYAAVSRCEMPGVFVDGGLGVGRVTKKGLKQAVGEAAINPVPKQMIMEAAAQVMEDFEYTGGLQVVISIPAGVEIAKKTFNPRLGIEGGISVLGTSGIVVPMSEAALLSSIRLEMEMLQAGGHEYLLITPGNYGETFTRQEMTIDLSGSMKCSNYVGETLDLAVNLGIKGVLFVAHIGKFIKVAGGIMNTHSRDADCRAELMAAFALRAGAGADTARQILASITTDEALEIMEQAGVRRQAMQLAIRQMQYYLAHRCANALQAEVIVFSGAFGYLGQSDGADQMLQFFKKEG